MYRIILPAVIVDDGYATPLDRGRGNDTTVANDDNLSKYHCRRCIIFVNDGDRGAFFLILAS